MSSHCSASTLPSSSQPPTPLCHRSKPGKHSATAAKPAGPHPATAHHTAGAAQQQAQHKSPACTSFTSGSPPSSSRLWMRWLSCFAACSNCRQAWAGEQAEARLSCVMLRADMHGCQIAPNRTRLCTLCSTKHKAARASYTRSVIQAKISCHLQWAGTLPGSPPVRWPAPGHHTPVEAGTAGVNDGDGGAAKHASPAYPSCCEQMNSKAAQPAASMQGSKHG